MAGKKTGKRLLTWVLVLVMALSLLPLNALAKDVWSTEYGSIRIYLDDATKEDHKDLAGNLTRQVRIVSPKYAIDDKSYAIYEVVGEYWWITNIFSRITAKDITSIDLARDKIIGSSSKISIPIQGNETYKVKVSEGKTSIGTKYLRIDISKQPPKAPDAPNYDNLKTLIGNITVNCTNTEATHSDKSKTYALIEDSYTSDGVKGDAENGYTYTVTINSQKYVEQFDSATSAVHTPKDDTATVTLEYRNNAWLVKSGTPIVFNVECNAQPELPTPATVTLSDANGNALIKKHLTITDAEAEKFKDNDNAYFCAEITPKSDNANSTLPTGQQSLYVRTAPVYKMVKTEENVREAGFATDANGESLALTFTKEGIYTFTVREKPDSIEIENMEYDETEYTMTVNVTKDADENKLNAAVSFKNGDDPVNEGYITFNNTYTAPTYPVYVYAFFAHDNTQLTGEVTVNGEPIEWNEDAENGEYFVTLGVYRNGTTKEPTDDATLDALNVTEYELAKSTSKGNGTKNRVALKDITVYPSPSGKVCNGAAGYEESADNPSWHLDGQVDVYTVTYDYNDGTAQGAPTSNDYYFGSYTIAAAPKRDGYTFTGWKDSDGTVYDADSTDSKINKLSKDLKLVAQWKDDKNNNGIPDENEDKYTVTYTDGVDGEEVFADQVYDNLLSGTATPAFNGGKPTRNGYVFAGWNPAVARTVTGNATYVAQWTARTDLSYTVHYYLKGTTKKVADDKTVDGQTFNADVKEEAIRIRGYRVYGDSEKSITIGTGTNEIIFYYTRASRPSTPSKPTLNTGDHYAYVMGYPDGTVRPNGSITRAEVSAILFRLLSDKTRDEYFTTESSFTDVKAGAWYNNSIATLEKAGVIVDTAKGGAFRPNEAITRAELAAMLAQFSDAKPVKGVKFSDVSAEHWAYEAIAIAAKMGWIEGYPDGTFRPDATITRAEMMTLVNRALERVPSDEDHLLSKRVMLTFPDCKSGDWFYIAVQEATNSHTYERAATEKNGDEQWTALRANRDWTQLEK